MITLILLRPLQSTPVQKWTFEDKSVIRIGRATDNNVVLYSAVVSRRHVEIRQVGTSWEIVNLGANGTYVGGQRISHEVPVVDGVVIRLARSGPQIQIRLAIAPLSEETQTPQKQPVTPTEAKDCDSISKPLDVVEDTTSPDMRSGQ